MLKRASCIRLVSLLLLLLVRKFILVDMKSQLYANSDTTEPNKGNTYESTFRTKKSIAYKRYIDTQIGNID